MIIRYKTRAIIAKWRNIMRLHGMRGTAAVAAMLIIIALGFSGAFAQAEGGMALVSRAEALRIAGELTAAQELYRRGLEVFDTSTHDGARYARICRDGLESIQYALISYPFDEDAMNKALAKAYPAWVEAGGNAQKAARGLERLVIDGKTMYSDFVIPNVKYRTMALMHGNQKNNESYASLVEKMVNIAKVWPKESWKVYDYPATYIGKHRVDIPRSELPASGTFKMWFPLPITLGYQQPVEVLSIEPDDYVVLPLSSSGNISTLYMEVPLEKLEGPLRVEVRFKFTHYEQHFRVDPDLVGSYDTSAPEYIAYTKSSGNVAVTQEIKATAEQIVGSEKNPYLAARKIYDYMINTIDYSFMPHLLLYPRSELRESAYVHEYKVGDCGAQGAYFAALCRAVGIPARVPGGWQLFDGKFSPHFWAEFFVPNYGWLPVDPSVGQASLYTTLVDTETRRAYTDFFFGRQDALRCVVQVNVDEDFIPKFPGIGFLPMAIQNVVASCDAIDSSLGDSPTIIVLDNSEIILEQASH
jgi:transglutaminase-like putative cysteine protease